MKKVSALGNVTKGNLTLKNPQFFKEELNDLSGDVIVIVSECRGKRSDNQNRYIWGVVYKLISDFTGYTCEEVHEYYKEKFLSDKKTIQIGAEEIPINVASTTKLSTKEFEEYCENIRRHAAVELQILIPEPNEK
jgi:hypothetical protein